MDPFIAYLNYEGLARFCTEEYKIPSTENFKNYYMHLTNYSLNKDNPIFRLPDAQTNILDINSAHKRTLTSIWRSLEKMGINIAEIQAKIEELLIKFLISM